MINLKNEMNRIILFFTIKHKGNWDRIYGAIKSKDPVTMSEMNTIKHKYSDNYISIIDEHYPSNFKDIYMPPLSIFTIGKQDLLFKNENVFSIWGLDDYSKLDKNNLSKNNIYALFYDDNKIDQINYLLEQNYLLIIVCKHNDEMKNLGKIATDKNVVIITEIPFEIEKADVNPEQNNERILLGVSNQALLFDGSKTYLDSITPIFKFEERKLTAKCEISDEYKNSISIQNQKN